MKKITLGCAVFATAALFIAGCNKETNTPPEQDTEFDSSKDVVFANSIAADIDMIASYMGERQFIVPFFKPAPSSPAGATITNDTAGVANQYKIEYKISPLNPNDTVICSDGKKRSGSVIIKFESIPAVWGASFYRQAGFQATITLNNYIVNGYSVSTAPGTQFIIKNLMQKGFTSAEKLKFQYSGDLMIKKLSDASGNSDLTWKGTMTKTLLNSNDIKVYNYSGLTTIQWSSIITATGSIAPGALLEYKGTSTGVTRNAASYTFSPDSVSPLIRDFGCSPDKVLGVTTTSTAVIPVYSERHPFINGIASFTTANKTNAVRKLDFGLEGTATCDDAGTVTIRGVSHAIDFKK